MNVLLEEPTPILAVGILVIAGLGVALYTTGRGFLLWVMVGVAALVGAGFVLERVVVTEREEVEAVIDEASAATEANRLNDVLAHIDPKASAANQLIRWGFQQATFKRVKLTHLEIQVINTASPPMAKVDVRGFVEVAMKRGDYPYNAVPIDGMLEFRRINGRWLVTDYKLRDDPRG